MSFCPQCGTQCAENDAFCSNCGSSLSTTPAWQQSAPVAEPAPVVEAPVWEQPAAPVVEAPVYQQPAVPVYQQPVWEQPAQPMYPQPTAPMYQPTPVDAPAAPAAEMPAASKVLSIIALVCGIMSLPMAFAYGSGLFFGIAAIIMGNIANNKAAAVGLTNGKARTGKKLGIAGTIVSGIFFLIFVIILVSIGEAVGYASSYYYY